MPDDHLARLLTEIATLRDPDADPELEALKAAISIEDVFGVRLEDADIGPALLNESTIRALLERAPGAG